MNRNLLTLDDLYAFYQNNNQDVVFSSHEDDSNLYVQVQFEMESREAAEEGLFGVRIKAFHDKSNLNRSYIDTDVLIQNMKSINNRPVLADIVQLEDGEFDFYGHTMDIEDDGEITYIEKPVGHFVNPDGITLEYDEENDRNFVWADAVLYEEYTKACDILRRKGKTEVSVELSIRELAYDFKTKEMKILDFFVKGCTLLGTNPNTGDAVRAGMKGSELSLYSFSKENNSFFNKEEDISRQLLEMRNKLDEICSAFDKDENSKGGKGNMTKLEELLQKYNVTAEDVEFETEGLSDEELENKFKEVFEEVDPEPVVEPEVNPLPEEDPVVEPEVNPLPEEDPVVEPGADPAPVTEPVIETAPDEYSVVVTIGEKVYSAAPSMNDIVRALNTLVNDTYIEDGTWYDVVVYPESLVMRPLWDSTNAYKQKYALEDNQYSLVGDREVVFERYLTQKEIDDLDAMNANYYDLKEFKDNTLAEKVRAEKKEVLDDEKYSVIAGGENFKKLVEDMDKYSIEDIELRAKAIYADYSFIADNHGAKPEKKKTLAFAMNSDEDKTPSVYGGLLKAEK